MTIEPLSNPAAPSASREGGYALIELIISLALVALLLSLLPGTLRLAGRTWKSTAAIEDAGARLAALAALRQRIEAALPLFEQDREGRFAVSFRGSSDSLELVADSAFGPGGGVQRHRIARSDADNLLLLASAPFRAAAPGAFQTARERVVLKGVSGLRLRYFGNPDRRGDAAWFDEWKQYERLPRVVELSLQSEDPDKQFAVMTMALKLAE